MVSPAPRHLVSVRRAPTVCPSLAFTPDCLVLDPMLKDSPVWWEEGRSPVRLSGLSFSESQFPCLGNS